MLKPARDAYKIYLAITGVEWFLNSLFATVVFVYRATQITSDLFQLTLIGLQILSVNVAHQNNDDKKG